MQGQYLNTEIADTLDIHHKKDGGSNKLTNLVLIHEHCHYENYHGKLAS